jgi:hypothetical protein
MSDAPSFTQTPITVNPGEGGTKGVLALEATNLEGKDGSNVAIGVFRNGELAGRTETVTVAKGAAKFARPIHVNNTNAAEVIFSLYSVEGSTVTKDHFIGAVKASGKVFAEGEDKHTAFTFADNDANKIAALLNVNSTAVAAEKKKKKKKKKKNTAEPTEAKQEAPSGPLFDSDDNKTGNIKFKTHDNDSCMGMTAPSLSSIEYIDTPYAKPSDDKPYIVFLWAQYHKPGYKFIPFYSQLNARYGDRLGMVGVSMDPDTSYAKKFLEDPNKKYSTVFPLEFAVGHDTGSKLKEAYMAGLRAAMSPPHAFLVANGKVVWHQDHSELGATVPTYMNLMEQQIESFLASGEIKKVGEKEIEEDSDSDSGSEMGSEVADGEGGDPWDFM